MLLNYNRFDSVYDYNEFVTLYYNDTAKKVTFQKALKLNKIISKSDYPTHVVPHVKTIWYLPSYDRTQILKRKDQIIDQNEKIWIILENTSIDEQNIQKIKTINEVLEVHNDDYINIYRVDSCNDAVQLTALNNNALIYSHIEGVIINHDEKILNNKTSPITKSLETIDLLINKNCNICVSDIVALSNDTIYEIIAIDNILLSPRWKKIKAIRKAGIHRQWTIPFV